VGESEMAIPKIKEMVIDCGRAGKKTIAHNHFQFNVIMCNLSAMSTKHSVSHVSVICLSSRGVVKGDLEKYTFTFYKHCPIFTIFAIFGLSKHKRNIGTAF